MKILAQVRAKKQTFKMSHFFKNKKQKQILPVNVMPVKGLIIIIIITQFKLA